MKAVDWVKYADILVMLQTRNDLYWAIKHFDGKFLDHVHSFDIESREALSNALSRLFDKVDELQKTGTSPESEQGQAFAKNFWDIIMDFIKGDMSLLPELYKLADKQECSEASSLWKNRQEFVEKALDLYFRNLGYNPFEED